MELSNDNWRSIFTYLTQTDLILVKTCNKHLNRLVTSIYDNNLAYNVNEVFYKGYYSLFVDYLYPMIGIAESRDLLYYVGLSCSMDLTIWLRSYLIESLVDPNIDVINNSLIQGVIRSGNLEFINAIYDEFNPDEYPDIDIECIIRSMSKSCVETLLERPYISRKYQLVNVSKLLVNPTERAVGFKIELTVEYLDYLTKDLQVLDRKTLFSGLLDENISLTKRLIEQDYTPDKSDFKSALSMNKLDFIELYLKANPKCFDSKFHYTVSSSHAYKYIRSLGIKINLEDSLVNAINHNSKEFVTYLFSQGTKFNNTLVKEVLPLNIDMLLHLKSLGYTLPPNIYEIMLTSIRDIITVEFFIYLQENGYHHPIHTPNLVFSYGGIDVIEAYLQLGLEVTRETFLYMMSRSEPLKDIIDLIVQYGHELPEDIVDIIAEYASDLDLAFELIKSDYKVSVESVNRIITCGNWEFIELLMNKVEVTMDNIVAVSLDDEHNYIDKAQIMRMLVNNYTKHQNKK